jgi:DNA-binding NarL/FixJ family response regulator
MLAVTLHLREVTVLKSILIADDSGAIRTATRHSVESQPGLEVYGEAIDGLDAVEKARTLKPDLIILDPCHASHERSPTQPSVRLSRAGIQWLSMGENIATAQSVPRAEAALMNEPKFQENHRANILSPTFTNVGIGIVSGPDGTLYITQDFVQLR